MNKTNTLINRIRALRFTLPVALVFVVLIYQFGVAENIEKRLGVPFHYWVEVVFYSLTGPVVTGLTLAWIEKELRARAYLENLVNDIREEERARIARDLHDGVAQALYLAALRMDALQAQTDALPLRDALRRLGASLRESIREIRRTIFSLHPPTWSEDDFVETLADFVRRYAEEMGWDVQFQAEPALRIPQRLTPIVFRITQEALNNAAKHARARRVQVSLQRSAARLLLDVRDDGRGFAPEKRASGGMGIAQMKQRAREAGGELQIRSQPGGGTHVQVRLPWG